MKKYIYPILSSLLGAIIFGIIGGLNLINYGGNSCDFPGKNCDCFCCSSLGLRGYEACANYGLLAGGGVGIIIGMLVYFLVKKVRNKKLL
jgi:hypothetical protein